MGNALQILATLLFTLSMIMVSPVRAQQATLMMHHADWGMNPDGTHFAGGGISTEDFDTMQECLDAAEQWKATNPMPSDGKGKRKAECLSH